MRSKRDLPTKNCVTCGRPFAWRKRWARCWSEVQTCSERCNGVRRSKARASRSAAEGGAPPERGGLGS